ncbi:MAG: secondary thiamine-phosphate synthase enzyme YjbQ [Deltaproteobacteria bacterium]|nr:secondary thiamine-phosphate synthase enzyme YjbQ [Deltaproteobacteria bacterium]
MPRTTLEVKTTTHTQAVNLTHQVAEAVAQAGPEARWCEVFVPHTTAAVTVNEAADPTVMQDVLGVLDRLAPWQGDYRHAEGNSAAHAKSILVGATVRLPVADGRLSLGVWQGVFFLEFDGPRNRRVLVDVA